LHRLRTNDAAEGGSAEQVIQNIEANVPPGSTHRDEAAIDVGPQRQPRAATNGFELPPHIEATPVVLEHRGSVGSRHCGFGDVRCGRSDRGELHPGSNRTQAPSGVEGRPLAQLRKWAPFDAAGSLGTVGTRVKLTTVGAPTPHVTETTVTRADAPTVLEYNWGGFDMRWQLEAVGGGTRLTLWTNIDRRFIAMGAAGWHLCFDVLDHLLNGTPLGRIVGPEAMKFAGWQRLHAEYAKQFGVETLRG